MTSPFQPPEAVLSEPPRPAPSAWGARLAALYALAYALAEPIRIVRALLPPREPLGYGELIASHPEWLPGILADNVAAAALAIALLRRSRHAVPLGMALALIAWLQVLANLARVVEMPADVRILTAVLWAVPAVPAFALAMLVLLLSRTGALRDRGAARPSVADPHP